MSVVFVLTDKGWKDQDVVTTKHSVYCYDMLTGKMDLRKVTAVKDVSSFKTHHLYNRDTNYGTYCNEASLIALYDGYQKIAYNTTVDNIIDRYAEYDISIPCHLNGMTENVRSAYLDPQKYSRFERDVKLRSIGLFHFEIDSSAALTFLDQWKNRYQRLNAIDYNQALLLQLVLLKGNYFSRIEQEIGFAVKPIEKDSALITNVDLSKRIQITQSFYSGEQQLNPICNISGDVVVC